VKTTASTAMERKYSTGVRNEGNREETDKQQGRQKGQTTTAIQVKYIVPLNGTTI
jgi:hypothetical protein